MPTEPAVTLLSRVLTEQGVRMGRGTCEVRPTTGQCLRLPLGAESALLMPDSLLQHDCGGDPGAAIDLLVRNTQQYRAQQLLDTLTNAGRQLSFPPPPTTMAPSLPKPPAAPAQQLPPQSGLTPNSRDSRGTGNCSSCSTWCWRSRRPGRTPSRCPGASWSRWPAPTRAPTRTASTLRRLPACSSAPTSDEPDDTPGSSS